MLDFMIGRRELGKTTLAIRVARQSDTRIFFDSRITLRTTSDVLRDGQIVGVLYEMLDTRQEIIIQPEYNKLQAFEETCAEIADWVRDNPGEKICFLVDDVRLIVDKDVRELHNPNFEYLIKSTPRETVTTILTCHSAVDLSTQLRRIGDNWCMFRTTHTEDLDSIEQKCGFEVREAVSRLNPYEFVVWDDSVGKWRTNTDKSSWYVPLNSSPPVVAV